MLTSLAMYSSMQMPDEVFRIDVIFGNLSSHVNVELPSENSAAVDDMCTVIFSRATIHKKHPKHGALLCIVPCQ